MVPEHNGHLDLVVLMMLLGKQQVNSIWVEAGPTLAGALPPAGPVHELVVYLAPKLRTWNPHNGNVVIFNLADTFQGVNRTFQQAIVDEVVETRNGDGDASVRGSYSSFNNVHTLPLRVHLAPQGGGFYLTVVWVPGAYELPLAAGALAKTGKYDAVIALGTVIRGGTAHFEYIRSAQCRHE